MGAAVLAVALACEAAGGLATGAAAGDLLAGLALLGGGAAMWLARPSLQAGPLAALAGGAWFAGDLEASLLYLHRGPLVHLLLTYPGSGRVRSRLVWVVIACAYVDGVVPALARSEVPTIVLSAAVIGVAAWRHGSATGMERRACATALAAAAAVCGALGIAAVARLAGSENDTAALWAYELAVAGAAAGLTADLLWGRWARSAVTGLVVDLGARREPDALRAALSRALGDPDLQVAFATGTSDHSVREWVDEAGQPVVVESGAERAVTFVEDGGVPVAALLHDPAALRDPALAGPVAAAARLAVATARLQAGVAERVREVAASRQRLVEAGDEERRRLGDAMRAGPEARLATTHARLRALAPGRDGAAGEELARLDAELDRAVDDLARFARGVHPRALTEGGLAAALAELTDAPLRVDADVARLEPAQVAALYFACSEGLANVAKHAPGAHATVTVRATGARVVAVVEDDGPGGADAARGSGLRGLADRLDALGGTLRIDSSPGRGTRVTAELPLEAAA